MLGGVAAQLGVLRGLCPIDAPATTGLQAFSVLCPGASRVTKAAGLARLTWLPTRPWLHILQSPLPGQVLRRPTSPGSRLGKSVLACPS